MHPCQKYDVKSAQMPFTLRQFRTHLDRDVVVIFWETGIEFDAADGENVRFFTDCELG